MVSSWMGNGSLMPWRGQGRDEVGVEAEAREGCGHGEVARFRRSCMGRCGVPAIASDGGGSSLEASRHLALPCDPADGNL